MARFDVYRLKTSPHFILDCQANILSNLRTHFSIPLIPLSEAPAPAKRLNPIFEIEGHLHAMVTQHGAAVPTFEFGERICSLDAHDREIMNAIDMLLTGY